MDLPLEEGYVYGQAPKKPCAPPDINAMFEAVGVPKGKLGELPHPKDWYAGAKERARLRAIEMEELFGHKDVLRQSWVDLVLADCDFHVEQVDRRQNEKGPVLGLAELLARTAHERPEEEERIARLEETAIQAVEDQDRLRAALEAVRRHLTDNTGAIRRQEAEDAAAESTRVEEKRAEEERKRKAEKVLARQAALLRGEELPPSDDDGEADDGGAEDVDGTAALQDSVNEGCAGAAPAAAAPTSTTPPPAPAGFLSSRGPSPSPLPSPELRGGLGRQLPPLLPSVMAGASPTRSERAGGVQRSPFNSP